MTDPALLKLRNMMCLFSQVKPHALTRLPSNEVAEWEDSLDGSGGDADLCQLLDAPKNWPHFSIMIKLWLPNCVCL